MGDSPLEIQMSCQICFAKSVGFTNFLGLIWSFFSFIEVTIFSITSGSFSSLESKINLNSFPVSSFILFPFKTLTQILSLVSVAIIICASNFFATSIS